MYERFTDRARKVMRLANQEAQRFNHEYIGTEHILLGLIKEGSGVGANVLMNLDIDLRKVRLEVEKIVQAGPDMVNLGKLPQTPRAKRVIQFAIEEARNLNHNYVGSEHLLLGLIREDEGVASQVLMNLGLDVAQIRDEILKLLGHNIPPAPPSLSKADAPSAADLPDHVRAALEQLHAQMVERLTVEKEQAVADGDFERAANLRDEVDKLKKVREQPTRAAKPGRPTVIWEYELLLPLQDQNGNRVPEDVLAAAKKRLHERFDAFLASLSQVEQALFRGDSFRLLSGTRDASRYFLLQLKAELIRDFSLQVAVIERPVELL